MEPPSYRVHIYSTDGNLQWVASDFRNLTIEHRTGFVSTATINFFELHPAVSYFSLDSLIEVWRRVPAAHLDWYVEYTGLHRTSQRWISEGGQRVFTSYSVGLLDLIRRRSIRYHADTDGSDKGPAPADDVIKQFVRENAGPLATVANSRVTDGVTPGLSVQEDFSQGPIYAGAHAWKNLLDAIREIGQANSVDFDVVKIGPAAFEFRTYVPSRGVDRRAGTEQPFVFSVDFGNMSVPSFTVSRTEERNSVLVLGPGEAHLRDTTLRESPSRYDSPWNLCEIDYDARNEDKEAALNAAGDAVLFEKRPAPKLSFKIIQTPQATYGKHYALGDLVTGRFSTVSADVKIEAVTLIVNESGEEIEIDLVEPV